MSITYDPPLGTPDEEAECCRAAWEANPSGWGWHIHHDVLCEERTYAIEDRIHCILTEKPVRERALRLRLLRPVIDQAKLAALDADYRAKRAALYADYQLKANRGKPAAPTKGKFVPGKPGVNPFAKKK